MKTISLNDIKKVCKLINENEEKVVSNLFKDFDIHDLNSIEVLAFSYNEEPLVTLVLTKCSNYEWFLVFDIPFDSDSIYYVSKNFKLFTDLKEYKQFLNSLNIDLLKKTK